MQLRFLGGAGAVGGSKLLVEHEGRRLLLDCGLFQGLKQLRLHNRSPLGVASRSIDAVVLTRAHGAHCGFLPHHPDYARPRQGLARKFSRSPLEPARRDGHRRRMSDEPEKPGKGEKTGVSGKAALAGAAIGSAALAAALLYASRRREKGRKPTAPPPRPEDAPETD